MKRILDLSHKMELFLAYREKLPKIRRQNVNKILLSLTLSLQYDFDFSHVIPIETDFQFNRNLSYETIPTITIRGDHNIMNAS